MSTSASYTLSIPSAPVTAPEALSEANLAHCAEGLSHLLHQFKGKPRLEAMVCVFLDQIQELENAFWALYTERTLEEAEGVQLDGLGAIVGEAREDRTDAVYRRFIQVRILVNRSNGKLEELYQIIQAALDTPTVQIQEHYPASEIVHVSSLLGDLSAEDLFRILAAAKAGAVRLFLGYVFSDTAATFTWGLDAGPDNATGWGSTTDASWGGDWASIIG